MPVIRWPITLRPHGKAKRSFLSWKIPKKLVTEHGIRDGQEMSVAIRFGDEQVVRLLRTVSGQELNVRQALAQSIRTFAEANSFEGDIEFEASFDVAEPQEEIDEEHEDAPNLTDKQATMAPDDRRLPPTVRKALADARLGQAGFRVRVLFAWKQRCAVTGVDVLRLLRASHIKPWHKCDNRERLEKNNGLPLIATLDAAFDSKLISFASDGAILYSEALGPEPWRVLGITKQARLRQTPNPEQQKFLAYHRAGSGFEGD